MVELLAAAAIMMILIFAVLQLTGNVLDIYNRSSNMISTNAEARQAFDLMCHDIETAIIKDDGNIWMYISKETDTSVIGSGTREAKDTAVLKFFSPVTVRPREDHTTGTAVALRGDICAVAYRIVKQNPFNTSRKTDSSNTIDLERYGLYRGVVDPELTFQDFMGSIDTVSNFESAWGTNPTPDLLDADLERRITENYNNYIQEPFNLAAIRIVDFEVAPLFQVGSDIVAVSSKSVSPITIPTALSYTGVKDDETSQSVPAGSMPVAIRLTLKVIDAEGDKLLRSPLAGESGSGVDLTDMTAGGFQDTYTKSFVRTIPLVVSPY